jgi:hypothetical protein
MLKDRMEIISVRIFIDIQDFKGVNQEPCKFCIMPVTGVVGDICLLSITCKPVPAPD